MNSDITSGWQEGDTGVYADDEDTGVPPEGSYVLLFEGADIVRARAAVTLRFLNVNTGLRFSDMRVLRGTRATAARKIMEKMGVPSEREMTADDLAWCLEQLIGQRYEAYVVEQEGGSGVMYRNLRIERAFTALPDLGQGLLARRAAMVANGPRQEVTVS